MGRCGCVWTLSHYMYKIKARTVGHVGAKAVGVGGVPGAQGGGGHASPSFAFRFFLTPREYAGVSFVVLPPPLQLSQ
eukprot:4068952-Prymnesium_polylepis.1